MKKAIKLHVNGERRTVDVEPNDTLLETLRDKLGLKSPKCGCDMGDCGACTVMFNGRTVRSCLVLGMEADGGDVVTPEGLVKNGPTKLQKEFVAHNSFQCGFCAPGIVMAATELLEQNPKPNTEEIKEAIAGNLCRCTGYVPIIEAIHNVAHGKGK
jgi:aerobic carbon-monoxide dehydrogenase small subunit